MVHGVLKERTSSVFATVSCWRAAFSRLRREPRAASHNDMHVSAMLAGHSYGIGRSCGCILHTCNSGSNCTMPPSRLHMHRQPVRNFACPRGAQLKSLTP